MSERPTFTTPGWAAVTRGLGLVLATLALGVGMIANVALEQAAHLSPSDPAGVVGPWTVLHAVQLGLGAGDSIAGGVWTLCVSFAGLIGESLAQPVLYLGLLTGLSGL